MMVRRDPRPVDLLVRRIAAVLNPTVGPHLFVTRSCVVFSGKEAVTR